MITVKWGTCGDDRHWCSFDNLDLGTIGQVAGVYVIWHGGNPARVVRVGQGIIAERITVHRQNREITAYRQSGKLFVTWAAVPANQRDGVEAYLAAECNPLVGDRHPGAFQIAVNSPWG